MGTPGHFFEAPEHPRARKFLSQILFAHALNHHQRRGRQWREKIGLFIVALAMVGAMCGAALAADTLAEVKKKGVMVAGVKDSLPPFGSVDPNTKEFVGYRRHRLRQVHRQEAGRKSEDQPVSSANRMPMLMEARATSSPVR